jgi:predicted dehydrogenase
MSAQLQAVPLRQPRLGFVGLGWIGRQRLDAIAASGRIEVAALTDTAEVCASNAASAYPAAACVPDLDALLECGLDGVVIATPNASHATQALACLAAGVPVFCQKPLATTLPDTERILEAARRADCLLGIDYSYRHVQGMRELRQRLHSGEFGEVLALDLTFHNAYGPSKQWCHDRHQAGGGCWLDLGIHLVDLALWLQGSPDLRVISSRLFSQGKVWRADSEDIEDLAYVELQQDNGAIVRLACSWNAQIGCDAQIRAELHAQRGGACWYNVGGSFLNFDLEVFHGTGRESLGQSRGEWGPGALMDWVMRLARDPSFDVAALEILAGARVLDAAYRT